MKKTIIAVSFVLVFFLMTSVIGCSTASNREIDMSEIVNAYEFEDCEVWAASYEAREDGSIGFVKAQYDEYNYIYFEFFTDAKSAQESRDKSDHPIILFFFSLLEGRPTWQTVETYNNVCITYFDRRHYEPFSRLVG